LEEFRGGPPRGLRPPPSIALTTAERTPILNSGVQWYENSTGRFVGGADHGVEMTDSQIRDRSTGWLRDTALMIFGVRASAGLSAATRGAAAEAQLAGTNSRSESVSGIELSQVRMSTAAALDTTAATRFRVVYNEAQQILEIVEEAKANATAPSTFTGEVARMNPMDLGFSQTTAGGGGRAAALRESMANGWNGSAVDAVRTSERIVTIDNTRVAVAQELSIPEIPVKIRLPSDPLPSS